MNIVFAILIMTVLLVMAFLYRTAKRETASTKQLLIMLRANPGCVEAVRVSDNDPITAEVKLAEADWQPLSGIHGVSAVRLFDAIRAEAPTAEAYVTRNGRPIPLDEFDRISRLQWPTAG